MGTVHSNRNVSERDLQKQWQSGYIGYKYMVGSETVRYLRITLCKLIENKNQYFNKDAIRRRIDDKRAVNRFIKRYVTGRKGESNEPGDRWFFDDDTVITGPMAEMGFTEENIALSGSDRIDG